VSRNQPGSEAAHESADVCECSGGLHGPNHEAADVPNPRMLFTFAGKQDARRR
jgi:hypothetical protein